MDLTLDIKFGNICQDLSITKIGIYAAIIRQRHTIKVQ